MVERYKLKYWDSANKVFSIDWAFNRENYVPGDCYVRAITEDANVIKDSKIHYSSPMTLKKAREYIVKNPEMLGQIHDCVGLTLEDICKSVDFLKPIKIRNIKKR